MRRESGKERITSINSPQWRELVSAVSKGGPRISCHGEQKQGCEKAHPWDGAALRSWPRKAVSVCFPQWQDGDKTGDTFM